MKSDVNLSSSIRSLEVKGQGIDRLWAFGFGLSLSVLMQSIVWGQSYSCTSENIQITIEKFSVAQNRSLLIDELVQCDSKAVTLLINAFESDNLSVVDTAIQTLVKIGKLSIPELEVALSSPNPSVRSHASKSLGSIDDEEVISVIRNALSANDPNVREGAVDAIFFLGPEGDSLLSDLIERLQYEQNDEILVAVISTIPIRGIGRDDAVPDLLKLLENQPVSVRREVIETLGILHEDAPTVVPVLKDTLQDSNDSIQESAVKALAEYQLEATSILSDLVEVFEKSTSSKTQIAVINSVTKISKANLLFASELSAIDQTGRN